MISWLSRCACGVALCAVLLGQGSPATAGEARLGAGDGFVSLRVQTLSELAFLNTVRQQYDFSCGSAALATMLTYHYGRPVTEEEVFRRMYAVGDKKAIERQGFSLLDMQKFLKTVGLSAEAYQVPLSELKRVGVPAIVPIETSGYRHFVVVKGIDEDEVLVGDPARGIRVFTYEMFNEVWNGVIFVIPDNAETAKKTFNNKAEWNAFRRLDPSRVDVPRPLQSSTLIMQGSGRF